MNKQPKKDAFVAMWLDVIDDIKTVQSSKQGKYENTHIELLLQEQLTKAGVPFHTQMPLLGLPDIYVKPNICIFADGCYYHGCRKCAVGVKYADRRKKDAFNTRKLEEAGFAVFRFWEHEILRHPDRCIKKVLNHIKSCQKK